MHTCLTTFPKKPPIREPHGLAENALYASWKSSFSVGSGFSAPLFSCLPSSLSSFVLGNEFSVMWSYATSMVAFVRSVRSVEMRREWAFGVIALCKNKVYNFRRESSLKLGHGQKLSG